ncbi:MAG: flagellar biosynthesis protein FlhF [Ruminiclostridium sp.]|nr:flagellar biosynthesis protein FlhF [Ruminiclostridium sp.]
MRIRRYTGKDAQEAMLKVKMDLGSEAIILSTRKVRKKGLVGLFSKPLTEVLAAIDEEYGTKKTESSDAQRKSKQQAGIYNRLGNMQKPDDEDVRVESLENRVKSMEQVLERIYDSVSQDKKTKTETTEAPHITPTIKTTEASCTTPTVKTTEAPCTAPTVKIAEMAAAAEKPNANTDMPETEALKEFKYTLSENEIEPSIVEKIIEKIKQFVKNLNDYGEICSVAEKVLLSVLGKPNTISFREDGKPTVVLFAGPTGVGKTTTLAKIAADYTLNQQKKVGLITADTYRIAAVDQLKTYAEILNIPVSVIYTPQEVQEAISQYSDKDLILIDTAGRSHKNAVQFSEIKMLVAAAEADEIFLVLSCSMGRLALREILNHYKFLKNFKLLFTKLDEVLVPGVILNARCTTGKSLSYTTAGQSVPDDIEIANVPDIVKSMLNSKSKNG